MADEDPSKALWDGIRLTLEAAPIPMLLVTREGAIHLANDAACALIGCTADELLHTSVENLVPVGERGEHERWRHDYQASSVQRSMGSGRNLSLQRPDGTTVPVEVGLNPMDVAGESFVVCSVLDLRERIRAEQDRAQLEKHVAETDRLRSLETLAGGVAHDFNNMLVSVLGNASMVRSALDPDSDLVEWVVDIEHGAVRAAELAKQMLAFSGGGRYIVERTDLAGLLGSFVTLLRSLVPRTVALRTWLDEAVPLADVDRGQMRQVITNLVGNAASLRCSASSGLTAARSRGTPCSAKARPSRFVCRCPMKCSRTLPPASRPQRKEPNAYSSLTTTIWWSDLRAAVSSAAATMW